MGVERARGSEREEVRVREREKVGGGERGKEKEGGEREKEGGRDRGEERERLAVWVLPFFRCRSLADQTL